MEDYQKRVIEEIAQLNYKMAKLEAWLLKHDKGEFRLMEMQLSIMKSYSMVLSMRIEEFSDV